MARDKSANEGQTVDATTAATAASTAANTVNANVKQVKLLADLSDGSKKAGETMPRAQFIRYRWTVDKVGRGQITKDLNAMNTVENGGDGKKIPYQVVFAVIKKGTPGGPDKPAEQAAAA